MVQYTLDSNVSVELEGDIILDEKSAFQRIVVVDNPTFGRMMLIGSEEELMVQFSARDEASYHEAVVHPAVGSCDNPEKVLIIGGGDGGVAREVLKHPVKQVTLVELDQRIIDISKKYFGFCDFDDPRLKLVIGNGKSFVEKTGEKFDVVILDLTDPSGPSEELFTKEFYTRLKQCTNGQGVISVQTSSPTFDPQVLGRVHAALQEVFAKVLPYGHFVPGFFCLESYCLASDKDFGRLAEILKKRKIGLRAFTPEQLELLVTAPDFSVKKVLEKKWLPSTKNNPVRA